MMFYLRLIFSSLLVPVAVTAAQDTPDLEALFGPSLSAEAEIFYPSWSNWTDDVQQRWSSYLAPSFIGAIKVATTSDIQNTVQIATQNDIPFLVTAGGHGFAMNYADFYGIDIDMSNIRYAELDDTGYHLTIGGATVFQEMWDVLYNAGREIQTGAASCVGSMGATLGAGVGALQGHRGLMIDALESVQMVTATGDLVTASETENSELFWGLRGAGWNFGIVTEATYQVYDATNNGQVLEGDMLFPASANRSVWETLQTFDNNLPDILSITVVMSYDADIDDTNLIVNFIYYGPEEDAQAYIQPFKDLGPTTSSFGMVPWNELSKAVYFGAPSTACLHNQHLFSGGGGLKHTDVDTFESYCTEFTEYWRKYPDVSAAVVFSRFPTDAVQAIPDDETAYAYRDISTHILFEYIYPEEEDQLNSVVNNFFLYSRAKFTATSGFDSLSLYNNYAHGDEGPEVWFSERKLPRLVALKNTWDPNELFSWYNPLPLEYP